MLKDFHLKYAPTAIKVDSGRTQSPLLRQSQIDYNGCNLKFVLAAQLASGRINSLPMRKKLSYLFK
jgi:hypothetical protein